jgi:hydroxypyruvate isomerase
MPKFAANLTMLFSELPFLERFGAAAKAGFQGVEYLFPYAYPKDELADCLREHRLVQVLHNLPAGNWEAGERGIACHPDRVDEFREGVARAIDYAQALGCRQLNCLVGVPPAGVSGELVRYVLTSNLRYAAGHLAEAGIRLLVEPINTFDIPGFYLSRTDQASALIGEVGSDNMFIQYDIYHAQRMEGELAGTLARHLPRIAHIQLADNPGRHEPGSGEINFPWLLGHLDELGYTGWVGCEYKPATTTVEGLGWLNQV